MRAKATFVFLAILLSVVRPSVGQLECGERRTCGDCMADAGCFWCLDEPEAVSTFPRCFSRKQVRE